MSVSAKTTVISMSVPPEQDIDCSASKQAVDPLVLFPSVKVGKDTVVDTGGCKDVNFSVSNNYQETSGESEITSPSVCASVPALWMVL